MEFILEFGPKTGLLYSGDVPNVCMPQGFMFVSIPPHIPHTCTQDSQDSCLFLSDVKIRVSECHSCSVYTLIKQRPRDFYNCVILPSVSFLPRLADFAYPTGIQTRVRNQ